MRRTEGARGQYHLAIAVDRPSISPNGVLDAPRTSAFEQQPMHQCLGDDGQIRTVQRRAQKAHRRARSLATMHGEIGYGEALGIRTVKIVQLFETQRSRA